jgi:ketosteroid isomerase-like protein
MRILLAFAAVVVLAPGIAFAGAGTGGDADDDAQIIADAKHTEHAIVVAYNDRKWDEFGALYAEDAVMLPPNQEPIRGRAAIVDYVRGIRDVVGELGDTSEYVRVRSSGKLADLVGKFTAQSGRVHLIYQGLYERQPDGSVLMGVDHFAFRDAMG